MEFNSGFKGLNIRCRRNLICTYPYFCHYVWFIWRRY